jgi:hypothetical protein
VIEDGRAIEEALVDDMSPCIVRLDRWIGLLRAGII